MPGPVFQTYCPVPRCPNFGTRAGAGYCPEHALLPMSRWRKLSKRVIARDHGICWVCGGHGATTVDHVIPRAQGGAPWDPDNLRAAHRGCNAGRRDGRL